MNLTVARKQGTKSERRRLSAEERRELILSGAMEVFAERGYAGASMGEIARAGGVTPAVIYDHFPSKADLQIELLERQTSELLGFVASALEDAPEDLGARMRIVADAYRRLDRLATSGISGFIEAGAGGALKENEDPGQAVEMFAVLVKVSQNGLASWWYEHPEVPREQIVDRLLEFCWTGLERTAGGK